MNEPTMGKSNVYGYVGGNPMSLEDPLGLWSVTAQFYEGYGGAVVLTGTGLHFDSIGFRFGFGLGGGLDINPFGNRPDPCAHSDSNSIGFFAEASGGIPFIAYGRGGNYGVTLNTYPNDSYSWNEYGGQEPELATGKSNGGWRFGAGALEVEAEASAGIEYTHNFSAPKDPKKCECKK